MFWLESVLRVIEDDKSGILMIAYLITEIGLCVS